MLTSQATCDPAGGRRHCTRDRLLRYLRLTPMTLHVVVGMYTVRLTVSNYHMSGGKADVPGAMCIVYVLACVPWIQTQLRRASTASQAACFRWLLDFIDYRRVSTNCLCVRW